MLSPKSVLAEDKNGVACGGKVSFEFDARNNVLLRVRAENFQFVQHVFEREWKWFCIVHGDVVAAEWALWLFAETTNDGHSRKGILTLCAGENDTIKKWGERYRINKILVDLLVDIIEHMIFIFRVIFFFSFLKIRNTLCILVR